MDAKRFYTVCHALKEGARVVAVTMREVYFIPRGATGQLCFNDSGTSLVFVDDAGGGLAVTCHNIDVFSFAIFARKATPTP